MVSSIKKRLYRTALYTLIKMTLHHAFNECSRVHPMLKVAQQADRDEKVCFNMMKKDQLCAIILMKRRQILNILLKMVAMATSHTLLRF